MERGRLIVIEGIDGAGKSTQAELLRTYLESMGRRVVMTAEPTALPTGKELRRVLGGEIKKHEYDVALMFVSDRIAHNLDAEDGLEYHLAQGEDVICDRYYYSSLAYQGSAVDYHWVRHMNLSCPAIRHPDLCLFLDLSPEESMRRIHKGRQSAEIYENTETLTRVRNSFVRVIEDLTEDVSATEQIAVIDASASVELVAEQIRKTVDKIL